jgi:hypothetical protein
MSHTKKKKPCEAEVIAHRIKGECEHVQKIHEDYGLGCIHPAHHSVVIREINVKPLFKKLILRLCDDHFKRIQLDDLQLLSDTKCCFGTDVSFRMSFRRNRL